MLEIESEGNWPLNSIIDINKARATLQGEGHLENHYLVGTPGRIKWLDSQIPDTDITFRHFILSNNLVKGIIETKTINNQDDVFLVWYNVWFTGDLKVKVESTTVKITGIVFQHPPHPRTLTNAELLERLKEAPTRDVVIEATLRMFQSLQGSAK